MSRRGGVTEAIRESHLLYATAVSFITRDLEGTRSEERMMPTNAT